MPKGVEAKKPVEYFEIYDLKDDLKKHAARGGGITVLSRALIFLIQTISTMILARILAPQEFGIFVMVTASVGFLSIFMDLGLTDAIIQKDKIDHSQITNLFWINIAVTSFIYVIIALAVAPIIAWFYSEPRLIEITKVWSLSFVFGAMYTQHMALLKRRMLFIEISIIEFVAWIISSILAIIMALHGWSYWALVIRQVLISALMAAGGWILCKWRPGLPSRRVDVKSMLTFGRNTTGSFIINYFARNLDKMLIGKIYGAQQVGYYHKAYYLFVLPSTQFTEALKNVATSTLSKLRTNPSDYANYFLKAISIISFIGMPISFYLMVESEDVVLLLLGPQWEQTVSIFRILAAGTGIWMIYSTIYWLHASLGRSDRLIRWGIFDSIITAIAVIVAVRFGPRIVAISYTIALYILTGIGIKYAGRPIGLKLRIVLSAIWRNLLAALLAGFILWNLLQLFGTEWTRAVRLVISLVTYFSLYLALLLAFYRSAKPILAVFSVVKDMMPEAFRKRRLA